VHGALTLPSDTPATTLRLTDEDRAVLAQLKAQTGLSSTSAVVRLALREARDARVLEVSRGRRGGR
jgi:uncharacterized protein (DUF1778 family)